MPATVKYISKESSAAADVLNQKLLNDTEKRDILKISLVEGAPVSNVCEDRTMVREPRYRARTTARKVHTSMRSDHDIVIFTSRLRLDFHLCFFRIL